MLTFTVLENYVALKRAVTLLRAAETKDLDWGHNQIAILYKLSQAQASMTELVEFTMSDKASVTRTVSSLEKMGYVKRRSDEADRRICILELTAKGKAKAEKAHAIRAAIGKKLESTLTPAEREQFKKLVEKITEKLV